MDIRKENIKPTYTPFNDLIKAFETRYPAIADCLKNPDKGKAGYSDNVETQIVRAITQEHTKILGYDSDPQQQESTIAMPFAAACYCAKYAPSNWMISRVAGDMVMSHIKSVHLNEKIDGVMQKDGVSGEAFIQDMEAFFANTPDIRKKMNGQVTDFLLAEVYTANAISTADTTAVITKEILDYINQVKALEIARNTEKGVERLVKFVQDKCKEWASGDPPDAADTLDPQ